LDTTRLNKSLVRLNGEGDFQSVDYAIDNTGGRRVLKVIPIEKPWGPDYLRFGLGLASDFSGDAYFNILASYRKTWLNELGAEWRNDFQIGRSSSFTTEFYQPLDEKNYFFVAPRASYERRATTLYRDDDRIASYDVNTSAIAVDLGSQFYRYGEMRLGILGGQVKPSLDTGPELLSPGEARINAGAYVFRLQFDQLDSVNFPRSGWRGGTRVYKSSGDLGADESYIKAEGEVVTAFSVGEHTFNLSGKLGDKVGDDPLPRYDQFQWGGFLQGSGFATGQLLGEGLQFGRLMYYHRIMRGTLLDGAYGGFSLEATKIKNPLVPGNSDELTKSGSIFIGSDTPLGPAYLGYGRTEHGDDAFYFFLGKPY
ncbi:MAG: BamA/TamA family outer membrane protein, partial [Spongiibacteraceae bacterium]